MAQHAGKLRVSENPLVQFAALVAAGVVAVGAVLLGAVLLSLLLGLAVLAGAVMFVRVWWLRRRMERAMRNRGSVPGEILEVEYTVVDERRMRDDQGE